MPYKDKKKISEYRKKYRRLHKEKGLCTNCARKAIPGLTRCIYCWNIARHDAQKYYQKNKEKIKAESQKRRDRYKQENKCSRCGAPLMDGEGIVCVNCSIQRQYPNRKYIGGQSYETNHETVTGKS